MLSSATAASAQRDDLNTSPPIASANVTHRDLAPILGKIKKEMKPANVVVMRSSQLDASRLDTELSTMLLEHFKKAFSLLSPRVVNAFEPEITLLLDYVLGGRTGVEGPALSTFQRVSWGLAFVWGKYMWRRLESITSIFEWHDEPEDSLKYKIQKYMHSFDKIYGLLSLINIVIFFKNGMYGSLVERLLRSRLVYSNVSQPRTLNFDYVNRQLIWHEISEFVLFFLPLVNTDVVKKLIRKSVQLLPTIRSSGGKDDDKASASAISSCTVCGMRNIPMPYKALPCDHIFCYVCLSSRLNHYKAFHCPKCDTFVKGMEYITSA